MFPLPRTSALRAGAEHDGGGNGHSDGRGACYGLSGQRRGTGLSPVCQTKSETLEKLGNKKMVVVHDGDMQK